MRTGIKIHQNHYSRWGTTAIYQGGHCVKGLLVMTGKMIDAVEDVLLQEKLDWLLVYGGANSILASALAASKSHIPVAHVEVALRSFNMRTPGEIGRRLSDCVASKLFCPTQTAVESPLRNLIR
jgi:UDP-GlcNAc3NAcA epimerase